MACGKRCWESYKFRLTPDYRPPVGGWALAALPADLITDPATQRRLAFAWIKRQKSQNNNGFQAIDELTSFLRQNGVQVSAEMKFKLSEAADDQWCNAEPSRCSPREEEIEAGRVVDQTLSSSPMRWASRFWGLWNTALQDDQEEPAPMMERWAATAMDLLKSAAGCKDCREHWAQLLASNPPGQCNTSDKARVWLWCAHNLSKPNNAPMPWYDVQRGWKWPPMAADRVVALMDELGF